MPHDRTGRKISVGDKVTVEFEVREVCEGETCNTTLVRNMPGEQSLTLVCQAKQCTVTGSTAPVNTPPDAAPAEAAPESPK